MENLNMQGSTVHQQNVNISEQGNATQTTAYAVPPEYQSEVKETARKIEAEVVKDKPSVKALVKELVDLAWRNTPAFFALLKSWIFKS